MVQNSHLDYVDNAAKNSRCQVVLASGADNFVRFFCMLDSDDTMKSFGIRCAHQYPAICIYNSLYCAHQSSYASTIPFIPSSVITSYRFSIMSATFARTFSCSEYFTATFSLDWLYFETSSTVERICL